MLATAKHQRWPSARPTSRRVVFAPRLSRKSRILSANKNAAVDASEAASSSQSGTFSVDSAEAGKFLPLFSVFCFSL